MLYLEKVKSELAAFVVFLATSTAPPKKLPINPGTVCVWSDYACECDCAWQVECWRLDVCVCDDVWYVDRREFNVHFLGRHVDRAIKKSILTLLPLAALFGAVEEP